MTKYSFILLRKDREVFLRKVQELGVMDVSRSSKSIDSTSERMFLEIESIRKHISDIKSGHDHHLNELSAKCAALRRQVEELEPWGVFDKNKLESIGIPVHYLVAPSRKFSSGWKNEFPMEIAGECDGNVYFVVLGEMPAIPEAKECVLPDISLNVLRKQLENAEQDESRYRRILGDCRNDIPKLQAKIDRLSSELDLYLANGSAKEVADCHLLVFQGFAPEEEKNRIRCELDKMDLVYLASPASVEDNPPIRLQNNRFIKQFEVLTSMYGLPVYNEFDPTVFLSIFFLLFFAMCMGDAGYGLMLIGIGLLLKGKKVGLAKLWSLIVTLGAGTFVIGIVMGGFFGMDLSTMAFVPDGLKKIMITGDISIGGSTYAKQMVLALAIGILHICLALIMKTIWALRNNGLSNSLGTCGWTLLIIGSIITLGVGLPGLISETAMKLILITIAAVSALGIYFFNKPGRNPLLNLGSGLWDTYNTASGLMGDVLSYIRLYALGLSGGMLGATFNQIAGMVLGTNPSWQWLPFIVIIIIGHALNIAMSCLGAFVHPLRLNFVEFFKNSDYKGRGREYRALK